MVQLLLQVLHSHVLTFKVDKSMLGDTEFDNLLSLWYDEENGNKTTDHYVIVTGIYRDDVANQLFLRVSSWGQKYYILESDLDYIVSLYLLPYLVMFYYWRNGNGEKDSPMYNCFFARNELVIYSSICKDRSLYLQYHNRIRRYYR